MADVKINLEAVTKEFNKALEGAIKPLELLLKRVAELTEAQAKAADADRRAAAASRAAAAERSKEAEARAKEAKAQREQHREQQKIEKERTATAKREAAERLRAEQAASREAANVAAEAAQAQIQQERIARRAARAAEREEQRQAREARKAELQRQATEEAAIRRDFALQVKQLEAEQARAIKDAAVKATEAKRVESTKQKDISRQEAETRRSIIKTQQQEEAAIRADFARQVAAIAQRQRDAERVAAQQEKLAQRRLAQEQRDIAKEQLEASRSQAHRIALLTNAYQLLLRAGLAAFRGIKAAATSTIENLDQFQRGTIATAIAITNLADPTLKFGKTWEQVFHRNLEFTRGVFIELERVAARYFASATDLQLAFNTLSQRGVVLRREELDTLGQLTDMILLLTGGQQSSIQIQEELRSLLNGSVRATAQLSNVIKAYGLDVKQVAAEIRATQSLKPLEPILVGAKAANKEVQGTFQATINALDVAFRQIQRIAGQGFFTGLTQSVQRLTAFINQNQVAFVKLGAVIGKLTGKGIDALINLFEKLTKKGGAKEVFEPLVNVIASLQTGFSTLADFAQILMNVLLKLPKLISAVTDAFAEQDEQVAKTSRKFKFFGRDIELTGIEAMAGSLFGGILGMAKAGTLAADKAKDAMKSLLSILPPDKAKKLIASLDELQNELEDTFAGVDKRTAGERFNAFKKELLDTVAQAEKGLGQLSATAGKGPQPVQPPFVESEESVAATKKLASELDAVRVRAAKATLALDAFAERAKTDLALQDLRRDFALIEQGFKILDDGTVQTINTIEGEFAKIVGENAFNVQRGYVQMKDSLLAFEADMEDVRTRIAGVQKDIQSALFGNLVKQADVASKGFKNFVQEVLNDAEDLRAESSDLNRATARKLAAEAEDELKTVQESVKLALQLAEERFAALKKAETQAGKADLSALSKTTASAIKDLETQERTIRNSLDILEKQAYASGKAIGDFLKGTEHPVLLKSLEEVIGALQTQRRTAKDVDDAMKATKKTLPELQQQAQEALDALRANEFVQLNNAKKAYDIKIKQAALEEQIADARDVKISADAALRIEERKTQLLENQLRISQQLKDLQGQAFRVAGVEAQGFVAQQQVAAEAEAPRTDIQARFAPIREAQQQFEAFIGQIEGSIQSLLGTGIVLQAQQSAAEEERAALAEKVRNSRGEEQAIAEQQLNMIEREIAARAAQIESIAGAVPRLTEMKLALEESGNAALKLRELRAGLVDLQVGLANAVDGIANIFTSALTDAFEGKKTDFKSAFKGVADNMFKEGMKPAFDSLKNLMGNGIEKAFKALDISGPMASQLGPAFMAGFGLIASFVLGQLMGDHGGQATAANPTVGIQSTEQVRGLIGGETQIPIGQIGESLQDALVPTNSILLRIARAVESQVSGLSPAQIENVISRAVTDAIQIQPV